MDNTPQKKDWIMKVLAIAGFVAVIIVIAWLAIKFVGVLPNAFSSLASLADGVRPGQDEELTIVADESVINSGDAVTVRWSEPSDEGSFAISYECVDGVTLSVTSANGVQELECNRGYQLGNESEATITIESEENRFTDVPYEIGYVPEGEEEVTVAASDVITVINASISPDVVIGEDNENEDVDVVVVDTDEEDTPAPQPTPKPAPQPEITYVYQIPVSDPNGYTDLAIRLLGIGIIEDDRFTPTAFLQENGQGAIQFEVKNIGTKTSEEWTFDADLPGELEVESDEQAPLRPNERAIFTVGFPLSDVDRGLEAFSVSIDTDRDTLSQNNEFSWVIEID